MGFVAAVGLGMTALARPAAAQVGSERYSSIVVDVGSGTVLSAASPDEARYPASLTKMMTLYMLFEALRDRRVSLNQYIPVSGTAAAMPPSKLGLPAGGVVSVEQALLGLVTKSANDAAAALGEFLGGDEDRFAQMMTARARALGMTRTTFRNASGLPDWNQVTTARDMSTLGRRLVQDFPVYYQYFSTPSFVFRGRTIPNHDNMLQTYPGADGLKTGWIQASGHNLVTSAVHGQVRLVGVVLGAGSSGERDQHMAALLDQGFDQMGAPPGGLPLIALREPALRVPQLFSSAQAAPVPDRFERPRVEWVGTRNLRQPPIRDYAAAEPMMPPRGPRGRVMAAEPRFSQPRAALPDRGRAQAIPVAAPARGPAITARARNEVRPKATAAEPPPRGARWSGYPPVRVRS